MKKVTGVVTAIYENEGKRSGPGIRLKDPALTVYLGKLSLEGIEKGCTIEAEGKEVGSRGAIAAESCKVVSGAAAGGSSSGKSGGSKGNGRKGGGYKDAGPSIAMQNSHTNAAALLALELQHEAFKLPAKHADRLDAIEERYFVIADKLFARVLSADKHEAGKASEGSTAPAGKGSSDLDDDIPF